jgi:riboflavin synthase
MVERGSVAIDGVSLTIHALPSPEAVQLSIIDYTRRHTTLGALKVGDAVHVEADIIAKHVRRLTQLDVGRQ